MALVNPSMVIFIYNVFMLALVLMMLLLQWRSSPRHDVASFLLAGAVLLVLSIVGAFASPIAGFGRLQLLAWAAFAHYPLFLFGSAYMLLKWRRGVAMASATLAAAFLAIFVDAFFIERRWLEVTHVTISTSKL